MLIENGRIGEIVVNPVDHSLLGVRHAERLRDARPHSAAVRRLGIECTGFPYGVVPYDLDISQDGRLLSASVAEVNGDQFLRVWELSRRYGGRHQAAIRVPLRAVRPREFRIFARRPLPLWEQLLHGRIEYLPLRGRDRRVEAVSNAETGFFRPVPLADGRLVVCNYTGMASSLRPSIRGRSRTSARSHSSAPSSSKSIR